MNMKEYILWGVAPNSNSEEVLLAEIMGKPINSINEARKLKTILEKKYNCTGVRIQCIDFVSEIDFIRIIK